MAVKVKKAVAKKKPVVKGKAVVTKKAAVAKKTIAKKPVARKAPGKAATMRGDAYICEECGLIVTVDEMCDCVDVCDIICCGESMTFKKSKARK
jgi:hypothetical protein